MSLAVLESTRTRLSSLADRLPIIDRVRARKRAERRRWALNVALLFIALAHRTDGDLSLNEIDVILKKLQGHLPGADEATLMYLMQEALCAYDEGRILDAVEAAAHEVRTRASSGTRARLTQEMFEVAAADGFTRSDALRYIGRMNLMWSGRPTAMGRPAVA